MTSKHLIYTRNIKVLKSFVAVLSLFAISSLPVEAIDKKENIFSPKRLPLSTIASAQKTHVPVNTNTPPSKVFTLKSPQGFAPRFTLLPRVLHIPTAGATNVLNPKYLPGAMPRISNKFLPKVSHAPAPQATNVSTPKAPQGFAPKFAHSPIARITPAPTPQATNVGAEQVRQEQARAEQVRQEQTRAEQVRQEQLQEQFRREEEAARQLHFAQVADFRRFDEVFNEVQYRTYNWGYEGRQTRTFQYGQLHLPVAPAFHPYFPNGEIIEDGRQNQRGFLTPAFSLNIKIQGHNVAAYPPTLLGNLAGIAPEMIDSYLVVQDMPWIQGARDLLLRLEGWLDPECPSQHRQFYYKTFNIETGIFSHHPNGPRIRAADGNADQPEGGLVPAQVINHNVVNADGVGDPQIILSPNNLPVRDLDFNRSYVLYSLTKKMRADGTIEKVALGTHVLLNPNDQAVFEGILKAGPINNLDDIEHGIRAARVGGHFADLNLDELF